MRLYGRDSAVKLVHDFMVRDAGHDVTSPVVVFVGPRGSGKSALLTRLGEMLDQNVPYARVDLAELSASTTCDVLDVLVFELNRHCAAYGRIAFPRFIVGRIVMAAQVDHTDPAVARAQIDQVIERHRKLPQLRAFLEGVAPRVLAAAGIPEEVGRPVPGLLLSGLTSWRAGRRIVLGGGQDWYAHQDRGLVGRKSLDVLAELNRRNRRPGIEGNRRWVDELMLAAFLADLRADFGGPGRRTKKRPFNCVTLLDNADGTAGRRFVDELVRAHEQRAADADDDLGPLTVVVTSRGPLGARVADPTETIPGAEDAGVDDYLGRRESRPGRRRWWYPVRLPDLGEADVRTMVADRELRDCNPGHVALTVHGFTHGHPGATSILLGAIAEEPCDPVDLRRALAQRPPGALAGAVPGETVRDRLWRLLLGDPARLGMNVDDLVTCAAARDMGEAAQLAEHSGLLHADDADAVTRPDLWIPGVAPGTSIMHPVLRRLLLERLAERDQLAGDGWAAVHGWLRRHTAERDDVSGELHHALALGELKYVTDELIARLRGPDADIAEWLALLRTVTEAPMRTPPADAPARHIGTLAGRPDPGNRLAGSMALLVAGLWIAAEPLITSERTPLYRVIEKAFRDVAPFAVDGLALLLAEAERYGALADLWS
ncbi:MAG TPA: hypothetical protein VFU43_05130 [Streptosporangiaceae bacterium]|nr:hypothetical protein [Streptosporangiaceae bacterium]